MVIGWFTRLLYDLSIRAKCLIPGTFTPLMGHNIFLRRADLFRVGGVVRALGLRGSRAGCSGSTSREATASTSRIRGTTSARR